MIEHGKKSRLAFDVVDGDEFYAAFAGGSGTKDALLTATAGADGYVGFGNDSTDGSTRTYDHQLIGEVVVNEIDGDPMPNGAMEKMLEITAQVVCPAVTADMAEVEALNGAHRNAYIYDALDLVACNAWEAKGVVIEVPPPDIISNTKAVYNIVMRTQKHNDHTNIILALT